MEKLVKLMIDAYNEKAHVGTNFSKEDVEQSLREALFELIGTTKIDYKAMRLKGAEVFALVEQALDVIIPKTVEAQFDQFAEVKTFAFGDKPYFSEEDTALFTVANISDGNGNLRRQRLWTGNNIFLPETSWKGVKIYESLSRFLAGRVDWVTTVSKIAESYNEYIRFDVMNAFVATYPTIAAPYRVAGAMDAEDLSELIAHIEATTGKNAVVYGTKTALSKIPAHVVTEQYGNIKNQLGHFGTFEGTELRQLMQGYVPNTTNWAISNTTLLVLPEGGVKPVKILLEGDSIIRETDGTTTADMSMEYTFMKKTGHAIVQTTQYGVYEIV